MTAKQTPLAISTTDDTLLVPLPQGITQPLVVQLPGVGGERAGSWPAAVRAHWNLFKRRSQDMLCFLLTSMNTHRVEQLLIPKEKT